MPSHFVTLYNLPSSPPKTDLCVSVEDDLAELAEDDDISDEVKMFLKQFDKQEQVGFSLFWMEIETAWLSMDPMRLIQPSFIDLKTKILEY